MFASIEGSKSNTGRLTSHFNRAVVSSQAFSKQFPELKTVSQQKAARAWLANGLEQTVPRFLDRAAGKDIEGAIYHLTDDIWIIPSLRHYGGSVSLVYNHTTRDDGSDAAIESLVAGGHPASGFAQRTHANIMHNKFLVRVTSMCLRYENVRSCEQFHAVSSTRRPNWK